MCREQPLMQQNEPLRCFGCGQQQTRTQTCITAHVWRWFDNCSIKVYQSLPQKALFLLPPPPPRHYRKQRWSHSVSPPWGALPRFLSTTPSGLYPPSILVRSSVHPLVLDPHLIPPFNVSPSHPNVPDPGPNPTFRSYKVICISAAVSDHYRADTTGRPSNKKNETVKSWGRTEKSPSVCVCLRVYCVPVIACMWVAWVHTCYPQYMYYSTCIEGDDKWASAEDERTFSIKMSMKPASLIMQKSLPPLR